MRSGLLVISAIVGLCVAVPAFAQQEARDDLAD